MRVAESSEENQSMKRYRAVPVSEADMDTGLPSTSDSITSDVLPEDVLIPEFPVEVVTHIFKFLSVRERRNASLVCQNWFLAGNDRLFSRNEKLVLHGYQNFETSLLSLSKTRRNFLNLEFHNCLLLVSSNLLSIAEKIRFLSFRDCTLSVPFKIELFSTCNNLNEFHFKNTEKVNCQIRPCFTSEIVESLLERKIVNGNLKNLRVYINNTDQLTDAKVESLFNIFPNINCLTFIGGFNSTLVPRIISMKHKLESLKIAPNLEHWNLLTAHTFTRLKKFSLRMSILNNNEDLFEFFARQKHLEQISLDINEVNSLDTFANRLIPHLIRRCVHLKRLKLRLHERHGDSVGLHPETFRALVSSNLISLKTSLSLRMGRSNGDPHNFTASDYSLRNRTLRLLQIPGCKDHRILDLFIQCFSNLNVLQLSCFYGKTLESIGLCQKNLVNLNLRLQSNDPSLYHWNLAGLEHLSLRWEADDTLNFKAEIIPLGVKYLRLSVLCSQFADKVPEHSILHLKKVTELEAVRIELKDRCLTDLETWSEICCSLRKLRMLCLYSRTNDLLVTSNTDPLSEMHQKLFQRCPSLRCLVQRTERSFLIFYRDEVDNSIKATDAFSDWKREDFFYTGKIAGSNIKFHIFDKHL